MAVLRSNGGTRAGAKSTESHDVTCDQAWNADAAARALDGDRSSSVGGEGGEGRAVGVIILGYEIRNTKRTGNRNWECVLVSLHLA